MDWEFWGWSGFMLLCLGGSWAAWYFSLKRCPMCDARGRRTYEDAFDTDWLCRCGHAWRTH